MFHIDKLKGGIIKAGFLAEVGIRFDPLVETVEKALGKKAWVQPGCRKLAYKKGEVTKILPKCRLLCEVDYDSMPYFLILRCSL